MDSVDDRSRAATMCQFPSPRKPDNVVKPQWLRLLACSALLTLLPLLTTATDQSPNLETNAVRGDCVHPTSYALYSDRTRSSIRRCINVSVPSSDSEDSGERTITPTHLEGRKAEASFNVVLENLHDTRNLETTYYVTDMTQASDFYWDRESGLRVNIGILNVQLVPEYEDVDHDGGDNKYMLNNPNNVEDRTRYQNIMRQFCRHPIPDHYSITLEVSRDRTTSAREIQCNSKKPSGENCPSRPSSMGTHLLRDVNEACHKMISWHQYIWWLTQGTYPETLKPAANSIVCTENSELLSDLFNQSYSVERSIRFPTKKCRSAISRCEQCLAQTRCINSDSLEKSCCQIDCYTLMDCKLALSAECTKVPVECAMGDAYRYTIQPLFHGLRSEVQCHVQRRRHTNALYELFFYLQLPNAMFPAAQLLPPQGTGQPSSEETVFQTTKVHRTVQAGDDDRVYRTRGLYSVDYLTVEHDTGIDLHDDLILRRQDVQYGNTRMTSGSSRYSVRPAVDGATETGSGRLSRPPVHEISNNIFVVSTQFERPFDYSTSTWTSSDECDKNATKMRPVIKYNASDELPVTANVQTSSEPFRYFLKSTENPPYIRFTVPGNMSILPFYFNDDSPTLRFDQSLEVALSLVSSDTVWQFVISGHMTGCPSYIAITVIDHGDLEELFRYDALVLCPPSFNITLQSPNAALSPDYDGSMTSTFEVRISDPLRTHSVYLTYSAEQFHSSDDKRNDDQESPEAIVAQTLAVASLAVVFDETTLFAVLAGVVLVSTSALTVALVRADPNTADGLRRLRSSAMALSVWCCCGAKELEVSRGTTSSASSIRYSYCGFNNHLSHQRRDKNGDEFSSTPASQSRRIKVTPTSASASASGRQDEDSGTRCVASPSHTSTIRLLILVYATLWLVYSSAATFTALSFAITGLVQPEIDQISSVLDGFHFRSDLRRSLTNQSSSADQHRRNELRRHASQVLERNRACADHVDGLYARWAAELDRALLDVQSGPCNRSWMLRRRLNRRHALRAAAYAASLTSFERKLRDRLNENLRRSLDKYDEYLRVIGRSPWTNFMSSALFNGTLHPINLGRRSQPGVASSMGVVLELDEVMAVNDWSTQFWQRYNRWLPNLPTWPLSDDVIDTISTSAPRCKPAPLGRLQMNLTKMTSSFKDLFDSTRFFVSSVFGQRSVGQSYDDDVYWPTTPNKLSTPSNTVYRKQAVTRQVRASPTDRRKSQTVTGSTMATRKRPTSKDSSAVDSLLWTLRPLFFAVDAVLLLFHITRAYFGYNRLVCRHVVDNHHDDYDDENDESRDELDNDNYRSVIDPTRIAQRRTQRPCNGTIVNRLNVDRPSASPSAAVFSKAMTNSRLTVDNGTTTVAQNWNFGHLKVAGADKSSRC